VLSLTQRNRTAATNFMMEQRKLAEVNMKLAQHISSAEPRIRADQQIADFHKQNYYSKFSTKFQAR
jgi:hypothetical protein